jgi:signal transduction histidine kinase
MRVLNRLHAVLSHDLRSPLNGMVLNLDLLRTSLEDELRHGDDEELRRRRQRYIQVLQSELSRLSRAVQTIIAQTVPPSLVRERYDLARLATDVVGLTAPLAARHGVRVEHTLPASPTMVAGHRDRIHQALLNVVLNAIEAMNAGGLLHIEITAGPDEVRVRVRDDGPGMAAELLARAFEPSITTKADRPGLGLYIARSNAEADGGQLHLDSQPQRGTVAELRLPVPAEARQA